MVGEDAEHVADSMVKSKSFIEKIMIARAYKPMQVLGVAMSMFLFQILTALLGIAYAGATQVDWRILLSIGVTAMVFGVCVLLYMALLISSTIRLRARYFHGFGWRKIHL